MTDRDDLERLLEDQLAEVADQIVTRLVAELGPHLRMRARRPDPREPLVSAASVARYLGCSESWVWAHASQLRGRRLAGEARAPLRFSLLEVDELLLRGGAVG